MLWLPSISSLAQDDHFHLCFGTEFREWHRLVLRRVFLDARQYLDQVEKSAHHAFFCTDAMSWRICPDPARILFFGGELIAGIGGDSDAICLVV